jgi:hypothetical protein
VVRNDARLADHSMSLKALPSTMPLQGENQTTRLAGGHDFLR